MRFLYNRPDVHSTDVWNRHILGVQYIVLIFKLPILYCSMFKNNLMVHAVWPKSLVHFDIATRYIKLDNTFGRLVIGTEQVRFNFIIAVSVVSMCNTPCLAQYAIFSGSTRRVTKWPPLIQLLNLKNEIEGDFLIR